MVMVPSPWHSGTCRFPYGVLVDKLDVADQFQTAGKPTVAADVCLGVPSQFPLHGVVEYIADQ